MAVRALHSGSLTVIMMGVGIVIWVRALYSGSLRPCFRASRTRAR